MLAAASGCGGFTNVLRLLFRRQGPRFWKCVVCGCFALPRWTREGTSREQGERDANLVYAEAAREPFEFWDLPEVNHTAAIRERPREYERRVVRFFDGALLGRGTS